jgi:ABC-2 type transport system permease protein
MATIDIAWSLLTASLRGQLEYRANFLVEVSMGLVYQGTGFVFIWVILSRFTTLGGWTLGEVAFLYGFRLLAHTLQGVLTGGLSQVDQQVREGSFDRVLIRPLAPLVQVFAAKFNVSLLGDLFGGVVLLAVANSLVGIDWSAAAVAYLLFALVGAILAEAGAHVIVVALAFRTLQIGSLQYLVDAIFFNQFGNYPLKIFDLGARLFLTVALPVAFVAYVPASVLLARTDELGVAPLVAYLAPLVGVLWFGAACLFWRRELRNYQSAGH